MKVEEISANIRCLEYRQDREDADYGSCLYARFYFNLDKYELIIMSDCGNYAYKWVETPSESFLHLMARIYDDYLLVKLCGYPKEFDYEVTKDNLYDYAYDQDDKKRLHEIFEKIESKYTPDNAETFIQMFEQETDGQWTDVRDFLCYDYSPQQKRIVKVFVDNIQPVLRELVKAESKDKE